MGNGVTADNARRMESERARTSAFWEQLATAERWLTCPRCGYRLPWLCTSRADDTVSVHMRALHACRAAPPAPPPAVRTDATTSADTEAEMYKAADAAGGDDDGER